MYQTDIVIVGAGVVGAAIARELSKYRVNVIVVDKRDDVGGDASKSNNSLIGDGADAAAGSLEAQMLRIGSRMMEHVAHLLDVPFNRCGAIMPAVTQSQFEALPAIMKQAFDTENYHLELMSPKEILEMEPAINPKVAGGIWKPLDAVVNPFVYVVAMAENAAENGVEFLLDAEVTDINVINGKIDSVETTKGPIRTRCVINAAALFSDDIAGMVGERDFVVTPRKGQFFILDKNTSVKVSHVISPIPTPAEGRGKVVLPTTEGNLLLGPTAEDLEDKEDHSATAEGMMDVEESVLAMVPGLRMEDVIHVHCGVRPYKHPEGYEIALSKKTFGYLSVTGVRSSGVTGSQGIAKYAVRRLLEAEVPFALERKKDFRSRRKGIARFAGAGEERRKEMAAADPNYGNVVCRCETVTEAEILEAIRRPVGARTIDAVKRRVRPGMGRCQGGFCGPRVLEILARELGVPIDEVRLNLLGSNMLAGELRKKGETGHGAHEV
jgi:glycerol-3-phosphate dehydrogenase